MNQHNRSGIIRRAAGIGALAALLVACGGSSDDAETEVSTPVTEAAEPAVTEVATTEAPVVTDPPAEEAEVDPAAIPEVPCAEYVDESGYPLKPCDSGVLVETLQRELESLFPEIAIDGLFGSQTFGFIQEFQTSNGLEATGLVSEELAAEIAAAESVGEANSGVEETDAEVSE